MNKTQEKITKKSGPARSKPGIAQAQKPAPERPSHSGERAEGEGMLAPAQPAEETAELEGEGSYSAARRYDEGLQRSVARGDAEQLAKEAARALDGPEGAELEEAARAAKGGHAA
jgi:hypothetical protein